MNHTTSTAATLVEPQDRLVKLEFDIVVIGGGPTGSTLATIIAKENWSVLVIEASKFPRFAVGEIISPTGMWRVWDRLGLTQDVLDKHFIRKWNGMFESSNGNLVGLEQDVFPEDPVCKPHVYTLERAIYDKLLIDRAAICGSTVMEESRIEDLLYDEDRRVNGVKFQQYGVDYEVECSLVVDASGRNNFLAKKLDLRTELTELKSFACFAHYENVEREPGKAEGNFRLVVAEDMWFWYAPLKFPKTSIGIVANRQRFWQEYCASPEAFFEKYINQCQFIKEKIQNARRITNFRQVSQGTGGANLTHYHARTNELVGNGWAIVGDAAGFIDPIFSAGLYAAQSSAISLADEIIKGLEVKNLSSEKLQSYKDKYYSDFENLFRSISIIAEKYFDPAYLDFYIRLGNKSEKIRKLYTNTFIAYDPEAISTLTNYLSTYNTGSLFSRLSILLMKIEKIVPFLNSPTIVKLIEKIILGR